MGKLKFEYRITIGYILVGCLWIVFSDKLLNYFIHDSYILTRIQTYKGWFYVIITALLFYSLLKKHLIKLRHAEQKAKESDSLKSAFLQNISHEIRTPMNSIIGFAEMLNTGQLTEKEKAEYLQIISKSSIQLLHIVNEVLDISLIETGNITITESKVNINNLLDEVYFISKPLLKKEVSFSLEKGLPIEQSIVYTDNVKIRQIINNLLNNAIKFTENGEIAFGYKIIGSEIVFFVRDTGIGIDKQVQRKIFERFSKGEGDLPRFYDGVGLGLAICTENIKLLNGKIWVDSEPNKGSAFYFTIPYKSVNNKSE